MAYIKISDPSIIDLSAWHQVINVVNQHSDSIDSITNNFGTTSSTPDWNSADLVHKFTNVGQQILYGRTAAYHSASGHSDTSNNGTVWYGTIDFTSGGDGVFSSQPVVTATVFSGNTANAVSTSNDDVVISVYNVTSSGFKYRLFRTGTTKPITSTVYINWMAIGPAK